ncbi:phosphoethanolamine transferase [Morganella psychrotolerans]|uniref:Phosphoethanolamine transferase n=3 Tax=Morganella psychrotolerans TaxID=368603 RepID=A0A5M9QVS9_9GAMM|nr:phosphoethanolamine transferase [Morganella psychrotolerans]
MIDIKKDRLKKFFIFVVAICILFFISKLMLKGAGLSGSERNAFLVVVLIVFLSASKKAFWLLVFPMCFIYAIYSPIGSVFGQPTYQYVASVFATDLLESKEFFSQIPYVNYSFPFLIISGILLYRFISVKYNIEVYRNKTMIIIMIIFVMTNLSPSIFFKDIANSFLKVNSELNKLNSLNLPSHWGRSELVNSKYKTYILIIGESARKDYHHAYGYPINNTPFMSESNGVLIDGLTSGGTNTVASLRLMLTKPDVDKWEPDYSLSFIDLVKSAGMKTYWVSNQGYIGEFDTPVSFIAKRSDEKYFIKLAGYDSKNTSDFMLLDKIKSIIENNNEKKLIVVHLYGSHPDACDRVSDYKNIINVKNAKFGYLNCYISSINKTDDLIRSINEIMNNEFAKDKGSYSILYFSDHGLAHREVDGVMLFNNNKASKLHYNIPLFKVSSDDKDRKVCKSFKSGLNFVNGIASWIGIENEKLDKNYSLFDCKDDPYDFGLKNRIKQNVTPIDPAIDLIGK